MVCGLAVQHGRGMRNPLEWIVRCCGGQSKVHGGGARLGVAAHRRRAMYRYLGCATAEK